MRTGTASHERGSATVLLLAAMAVVATVAATALSVGTVAARRQQAATAADLAALAAASGSFTTDGRYCRRGERVAAANGARLVACQLAGDRGELTVTVTAAVDLPGLLAPLGPVLVRSRAGPGPQLATTPPATTPPPSADRVCLVCARPPGRTGPVAAG